MTFDDIAITSMRLVHGSGIVMRKSTTLNGKSSSWESQRLLVGLQWDSQLAYGKKIGISRKLVGIPGNTLAVWVLTSL